MGIIGIICFSALRLMITGGQKNTAKQDDRTPTPPQLSCVDGGNVVFHFILKLYIFIYILKTTERQRGEKTTICTLQIKRRKQNKNKKHPGKQQ